MTSERFQAANFIGDRSCTKIAHAPGGGSNFSSSGCNFGSGGDASNISVTTGKPTSSTKRDHNARSDELAQGFRTKGSNAHANGANQNCGNYITDRSTSKVSQVPGGKSHFDTGCNFGSGDASNISVTTGKPTSSTKRDHNARSNELAQGFRTKGSNAHANGANQNCGNYITDRPTSKVSQVPGGKSNFSDMSFGGKDTSQIKVPNKRDPNARYDQAGGHGFRAKGSNAHANGANQNCGNCITDRPTSKVSQVPGGKSNFGSGLGFGGAEVSTKRPTSVSAAPVPLSDTTNTKKSNNFSHGFRSKGSNAHANGANQNCGNHITERPTSRVSQAPGGASQIMFG